jgi:hypothetical protein
MATAIPMATAASTGTTTPAVGVCHASIQGTERNVQSGQELHNKEHYNHYDKVLHFLFTACSFQTAIVAAVLP